jgi:predicted nuclease of predicted toxin-antitoxin system
MRILADENFPRPTIEVLRRQGHDVLWARTGCPDLKDRALLERAEADSRLVLTLDKDFWQVALQRPVPLSTGHSWAGHVSIVTKDGIEMIPTVGRQ